MPRAIPDHERTHIRAHWRNWDVLTVREAAAVLNCSEDAVRKAMNGGQLPARSIGKRAIVPVPALIQWLSEGERQCSEDTSA